MNMSPTATANAIQIVGEDQQFNKGILPYVQKLTAKDIGLHYHIISVFGSQSTGKSTLLNALFGTKFDVMDESKRQQTTKGIWLAYAAQIASFKDGIKNGKEVPEKSNNVNNVLVMDVEGTDGRERGEDQDFERKAALFALSTSEILIINIWEHQVGLYQGANMALLKTVFEVNLSLFANANPRKCLLLFVIRDHVGTTSLNSLSDILTEDLNKIWSQLSKPQNVQGAKIEDYFDLAFTSLPHKVLRPEEFTTDVGKLGDKFLDENDSYFQEKYHKQIPFDGWTIYSENVWDQIVQNKELDLPTQQILVSRFRCDEIVNSSYELFEESFKQLFPDFDGKTLPTNYGNFNIGETFSHLRKLPLESYDNQASRYTKSVYLDKKKQLLEKIDLQLVSVYKIYLNGLKQAAIQQFNNNVADLRKSKKWSFKQIMEDSVASSLALFEKHLIKDDENVFKSDLEYEELKDSLQKSVESQRTKELKSLISKFFKKFTPQLKEKTVYLLNNPSERTWEETLYVFNDLLDKSLSPYKSSDQYDFGLGLSASKNQRLVYRIKKQAWKSFTSIVHDHLSEDTVVKIMRDRFEDRFRYNAEGVPMVWNNSTEIDLHFKAAKQEALTVLPILSLAKTENDGEVVPDLPANSKEMYGEDTNEEEEEDDDDDELDSQSFAHILSDVQQNSISNKFKKQIDILYIDAKRSTIQSITSIPYWIYVVIIVLGWNEFMAIVKNPIYFTFLALLLVSAYFIHQLNMWGPVRLVITNTVNETVKVSKAKLKELLLDEEDRSFSNREKVESIPLQDLSEKSS